MEIVKTILGRIPEVLKAIMGLVVGVGSSIVTRLVTDAAVLPTVDPFDVKGWLIFLAIAVLGYLGVYIPPNATADPQRALGRSVRIQGTRPGELLTQEVSTQITAEPTEPFDELPLEYQPGKHTAPE